MSFLKGNNTPLIDQLPKIPYWVIEAHNNITDRRIDPITLDQMCDKYKVSKEERKIAFLEVM